MIPKKVTFNVDARKKLKKGVDLIADSIKVTLGPRGRNVIHGDPRRDPIITKDGVTVARQVDTADTTEQLGVLLVRQAAQKTADVAGDGTTTAAILVQAIFDEGLKATETGANPILIKQGIDSYVKKIISFIGQYVRKEITEEDILKVATISANNDPGVGAIIGEAVKIAKRDGVITVEDNYRGSETYVENIEGMRLNEGFLSHWFITNDERQTASHENPYILITEREIRSLQDIVSVVEMVIGKEKRPLVIIASDVSGQALGSLVLSYQKNQIPVLACKAPYFGENRLEQLNDLAILTGGRVVGNSTGLSLENVELSDLGQAEKITANKYHTTVLNGKGNKELIDARIKSLQSAIDVSESDYQKEKLQERLAKLTSGVCVLRVGAATTVELTEKKMRIEDALCAARAAIEEGIVPGGGIALLRAAKHLEGMKDSDEGEIARKILINALKAPIKQLATNAGVDGSEIIATIISKNDFQSPSVMTSSSESFATYDIHLYKNEDSLFWGVGYDFLKNEYVSLTENGIVDPFKVVRLALENAASVAGMLLTTDVVIAEDETYDEQLRLPKLR